MNSTQEPWTFKALWGSAKGKGGGGGVRGANANANAEVTVNIPIPWDSSANNGQGAAKTGYYNMRIADMRVLLLPGSSTAGKPVELYIKKSGKSFFLDEGLNLFTFNHPPVDYGQLVYDKDYCPLSTNACSNSTGCTGSAARPIQYRTYKCFRSRFPTSGGTAPSATRDSDQSKMVNKLRGTII